MAEHKQKDKKHQKQEKIIKNIKWQQLKYKYSTRFYQQLK
jgi:hypothetical protein